MKASIWLTILIAVLAVLLFSPQELRSHCDTLDGPVIREAASALKAGDVTPVLKWVRQQDEKEIRDAFAKAVKVRALGDEARDMADMHFFQALVRVHRAGEGLPYTGVKPVGTIDPGIAAADKALNQESVDELAGEMAKAVEEGIRGRFADAAAKKKRADESVEAGRAFVAAYVEYVHFIEAVHAIAGGDAAEHHHLHSTTKTE